MKHYVLGLDFGTLSARAVIADVQNGHTVAEAVCKYRHGVMEQQLPDGTPIPTGGALQHPRDYIDSMQTVIKEVLRASGLNSSDIAGIGVDFTACTLLAVDETARPMCEHSAFASDPNAYVKLWKSRSAEPQAQHMNRVAHERRESWLPLCGGYVSAEFLFPKIYETLENSPSLFRDTYRFIEAGDWIIRLLTGEWVMSEFFAGIKSMWSMDSGFPDNAYLSAVDERLCDLTKTKICTNVISADGCVGFVSSEGATLFGLAEGTAVAVSTIDAHSATPALNCCGEGELVMILGTSACYLVNAKSYRNIKGVCGLVQSRAYNGLYTYEQSQRCFGDGFSKFIDRFVPKHYTDAAEAAGMNIHQYLAERASKQTVGAHGLLVLDWFNGNKSILADNSLRGVITGLTLDTQPEDIYRALLEGAAFGARVIIENYMTNGIPVRSICASGGIALKDAFLMQILADVIGMPIKVSESRQACALGSAMRAAVACGAYDSITEAATHMSAPIARVYEPIKENQIAYDRLYREYKKLHDGFGMKINTCTHKK